MVLTREATHMDGHSLTLDDAAHYRIYAKGRFDSDWLDMLSGVWVICKHQTVGKDITILVGEVADQAALMGVLEQLYNLGFPLLLVEYISCNAKRKA